MAGIGASHRAIDAVESQILPDIWSSSERRPIPICEMKSENRDAKLIFGEALRLKECAGKSEVEAGCAAAKQGLNTSPKGEGTVPMQYDVLLPGGQPVAGLIPWTAKYNLGSAGH